MTSIPRSDWRFFAGLGLRLVVVIVLLLIAAHWASGIKDMLGIEVMPHNEAFMHKMIVLGLLAYVVLTAIPFVPGAEIGMTLLTVFGAKIAPLIYGATVLSLLLAYAVGRMVPMTTSAQFLRHIRLEKPARLLDRLNATPLEERAALLLELSDQKALRHLARHRYVALAVLINVPGNVVLGGGGGLALVAGLSGVFTLPYFLLTIAIAVLPVPLMIFLSGV